MKHKHICVEEALLSFDTLKQRFELPSRYFFRYLQVRHTFSTKFDAQPLTLLQSNIESLLHDDQLVNPLSNIYKSLLPSVHFGLESLYSKWQEDFPNLDTEDWEEVWEYPFLQLIVVRDHLIQFKLLHRTYLTPQTLNKICPGAYPHCWRCGSSEADFCHMLWSCPRLGNGY